MYIYILQKTVDAEVKAKLKNLVRVAVERAETLKGIKTEDNDVMKHLAKLPSVPETNFPDIEQSIQSEQPVTASSTAPGNKYILKAIGIFIEVQ